jgi:hypothetical protein
VHINCARHAKNLATSHWAQQNCACRALRGTTQTCRHKAHAMCQTMCQTTAHDGLAKDSFGLPTADKRYAISLLRQTSCLRNAPLTTAAVAPPGLCLFQTLHQTSPVHHLKQQTHAHSVPSRAAAAAVAAVLSMPHSTHFRHLR